MKKHSFRFVLLLVACSCILSSCEYVGGGGRSYETSDGVADLVGELNSEFGKEASYTRLNLSYHEGSGTAILARGTKDPDSKRLIEKLKMKGVWEDKSEITLEIEGDAKPGDFMFTMKDVNDLKKIPELVKQSVEKVMKEKNMTDLVANAVSVSMPDRINSPDDKLRYIVYVEPKNGGTTFTLIYDDQGNFKTINY